MGFKTRQGRGGEPIHRGTFSWNIHGVFMNKFKPLAVFEAPKHIPGHSGDYVKGNVFPFEHDCGTLRPVCRCSDLRELCAVTPKCVP